MPPEGRSPLSAADRKLLREWVTDGAKWAMDPIDPFLYTSDRRAGYDWWSLQLVRAVEPPPDTVGSSLHGVSDETLARWRASPIDRFILKRLEAAGLKPASEADRRTLIRRLSFDVLGLPPSPEDVSEFVADPDALAYDRLVDRLLESPHYGERGLGTGSMSCDLARARGSSVTNCGPMRGSMPQPV